MFLLKISQQLSNHNWYREIATDLRRMGLYHEGMVDERLFDGTIPTSRHGKPGIAFTVHCFGIRHSTLLLRCRLVKKRGRDTGKREREKDRGNSEGYPSLATVGFERIAQWNILNRWLHEHLSYKLRFRNAPVVSATEIVHRSVAQPWILIY